MSYWSSCSGDFLTRWECRNFTLCLLQLLDWTAVLGWLLHYPFLEILPSWIHCCLLQLLCWSLPDPSLVGLLQCILGEYFSLSLVTLAPLSLVSVLHYALLSSDFWCSLCVISCVALFAACSRKVEVLCWLSIIAGNHIRLGLKFWV